MKRLASAIIVATGCLAASVHGQEEASVTPILIAQGKDLRNESFGARRIVRRGDTSYVGYSELIADKWHIRVRPFDHRTATFGEPADIALGTDDHSIMGLVADSGGCLHCVTGGHGRLVYVCTVRPDDISEWSEPQQIADEGTYAMLTIDRRDTMYVFYRHKWINLAMQTCRAGGEWTPTRIIGTTTANKGFYIMGVAMGHEPGQQSLHVVGHFYGEPETFGKPWPKESYGYRVMPWYIGSPDGGRTWRKADGTTLELPVTDETIDIPFDLPDPYDIPWSVDVAIDDADRPHVLCAWSHRKPVPGLGLREVQREIGKLPSQLWELTWGNGRWARSSIVTSALADAHITHPATVFANGALHTAVSVSPSEAARVRGEDAVGRLLHLWRTESGEWRDEVLDTSSAYANMKLPDETGVIEAMWRGRPATDAADVGLWYASGLAGSAR
jgi:hypothetical protein